MANEINIEKTNEEKGQVEQSQSSPSLSSSISSSNLQEMVVKHLPLRETTLPSVSILKPLMGVDPNLQQNLETFFTMNYETVRTIHKLFILSNQTIIVLFIISNLQYELLFCVENKLDPAVVVVDSLMQKYPKIDSKLFIGM